MNEADEILFESLPDAVSNMALALQGFVQECQPDSGHLDGIDQKVVAVSNQISTVANSQEKTLMLIESVKQVLEKVASINSLLDKASQVNLQLSSQHYQDRIITPMLRWLFPIFDLAAEQRSCRQDSVGLMDAVLSQLKQFAVNYDVELIEHRTGDKFNPKTMRPINWQDTPDKNLEGLVAKSLRCGFKLDQERMLRPETVTLFKYKPSQTDSINLNEKE